MQDRKMQRIEIFEKNKELYNFYQDFLHFSKAVVVDEQNSLLKLSNTKKSNSWNISWNQKKSLEDIPHEDTAVLVFSSAKSPGGGILRGSSAQEEDISLVSSWYFQVKDIQNFYDSKNSNALNTSKILLIEKGYVFLDEYMQEIKNPYSLSLIGCAAPNLKGMLEQKQDISLVYSEYQKRLKNILVLAENLQKKNLVLGAWGCGVFGLDPQKIANIFSNEIHQNYFSGNIIMNIPNVILLNQFKEFFSKKPLLRK